jgi:non-heme chloroperoxidase
MSSYELARRAFLQSSAALTVAACTRGVAMSSRTETSNIKRTAGEITMKSITTRDGTSIFYKDWGHGQPIVFCHGWPLSSDAWDEQLLYFGMKGYRVIAHDRRGHGRSTQTWQGNDMDTYADDLADLLDKLNVENAVMVGHSTGGGEVTRYLGRHGSRRVAKAVLVSAIPPLMLKTPSNQAGTPLAAFDEIRSGVATNRSQYYKELAVPFHGANRPGAHVPAGLMEQFWLLSMQAGIKPAYDCIKVFSETDFTQDLKKITTPVLIIHGEDDQIVPIDASARAAVRILKSAELKVYAGASHAIPLLNAERFNADVLSFVKG